MSCTICSHPQRRAIDRALVAGSAPLAELAKQYNLSTSTLHRHKGHLQARVNRAHTQIQDNLRQGCFFWLSQVLEILLATIQAARAEGNFKVVLQASSQGTRIISLLMKHELPLDNRFVYEALSSPQWATQTGLLPLDPNLMAARRGHLAETLASPCPETEPPDEFSASPADLEQMQQVLQSLAASMASVLPAENPQPQTSNHPVKWEKGGKLAGKKTSLKRINELNHKDSLSKKPASHIPGELETSPLLDALAAGRLDLDTLNAIGAGRGLPEPLPIFAEAFSPEGSDKPGNSF